jgi:hypothetical protein
MKGDIAFVGFMLTADEWQQLDTEARASLIAVATRRADSALEPPRRLAEGTGKHEAVAGEPTKPAGAIEAKAAGVAKGLALLKIDIAGGRIEPSSDDDASTDDAIEARAAGAIEASTDEAIEARTDDVIDADLDELLVDTELEHMIDLIGADGEIEDTLCFEALDHEAALAAAAEMAAAGVAPPVAGQSAVAPRVEPGLAPPAAHDTKRHGCGVVQTSTDLNWAEADDDLNWAAGENWAKHGDVNWANCDAPTSESTDRVNWSEDDDLNWADL